MRLKNLKKETTVAIKNKNEYFLLMDLLEKAGYRWRTGDRPTAFNSRPELYGCGNVELYPETKKIVFGYLVCGKPIRKVVKYEKGDTVRVRKGFVRKKGWLEITKEMCEYAGRTCTIERADSDGTYLIDNWFWLAKWLEPAIEEESSQGEVDWSKVEVDTPILVRNYEDREWVRRYFAKLDGDIVYAWDFGTTSWSACGSIACSSWNYAKLAGKE